MDFHLFSSPGAHLIQDIVVACRPYLTGRDEPTVAYLPAAATGRHWLEYTREAFSGLAIVDQITVETMHLSDVEVILERAAVVYIPGGNTFLLNHRLYENGILPLLRQKVVDGLPLVAFSAGTVLCGADILASNDMNICTTTHFSALQLLPLTLNVHYPSKAGEQARRDEWLQDYHLFHARPILTVEDGAYLRVRWREVVAVRGNCWLLAPNARRQPFRRLSLSPSSFTAPD